MRSLFWVVAVAACTAMFGFGVTSIAVGQKGGKPDKGDKGNACPDHTPGAGRQPPPGCGQGGGTGTTTGPTTTTTTTTATTGAPAECATATQVIRGVNAVNLLVCIYVGNKPQAEEECAAAGGTFVGNETLAGVCVRLNPPAGP